MKPRPFRIAQVIAMRLSHARDSSTVLPLREKFIIKRATDAVTIYGTVVHQVSVCQFAGYAKYAYLAWFSVWKWMWLFLGM